MTAVTQTTVAALFYATTPEVSFARLVADLDAAVAGLPHTTRCVTWDCDDAAMVDVDGGRILLGWADRLPGPLPACLAVSVGPGPNGGRPDPMADRAATIAQMIVARLTERIPPAATVWQSAVGVMTAERLDAVVELLAISEALEAALPAPQTAGALAAPAGTRTLPAPAGEDGPDGLDRLLARMEEEMRIAAAAAAAAIAVANADPERERGKTNGIVQPRRIRATGRRARARARDKAAAAVAAPAAAAPKTPKAAHPDSIEAGRLRGALYPAHTEPEVRTRRSTSERIAVGLVSSTLVIVAAPVGAALLTYSALRGPNLVTTARAAALTAAGIVVVHSEALPALLALV